MEKKISESKPVEPVRSRGRPVLINAGEKATFLSRLRDGLSCAKSASQSGFSLSGLYDARKRDPVFATAWKHALELSALRERFVINAEQHDGDHANMMIRCNNRRIIQKRWIRHMKFGPEAQVIFLDFFAQSCNFEEAAAQAGVDRSTIFRHLRRDVDFAAAFQATLESSYPFLEAEALRQRLEMQKKIRAGQASKFEIDQDFDQVMAILKRWDRHRESSERRVGMRHFRPAKRKPVSFDEAITALHKRLQNLNIPIVKAPSEDGEAGS